MDASTSSAAGGKRRLEEEPDDDFEAAAAASSEAAAAAKRARPQPQASSSSTALVASSSSSAATALVAAPANPFALPGGRSSSLEAPIMSLTGHRAAVYAVAFSPDGGRLATAGKDRDVLLWRVYGEGDNYALLRGHKNAVLDVAWAPDGERVYTASADKTAAGWDAESGARVRSFAAHPRIVNALAVAPGGSGGGGSGATLATACDDGSLRLWDVRAKAPVATFADRAPLLAVAWAGGDAGAPLVFAAGVEGAVRGWDVRRGAVAMELRGHADTVTGLAADASSGGGRLLSYGMDGGLRAWDVRPFCPAGEGGRCTRLYRGGGNTFEQAVLRPAWSGDGERVAAGSAVDRMVYVWNAETGAVEYRLPGHTGAPYAVAFHPTEPILASGGADKRVWLGELAPVLGSGGAGAGAGGGRT